MNKPYKKNYVSVLVDPATQKRQWVNPNDIIVTLNGVEYKLGSLLEDLQKNKTSINEFNEYKLKNKKRFKYMLKVIELLVSKTNVTEAELGNIKLYMEEQNEE